MSQISLGCYPFTSHWHNKPMRDKDIVDILQFALNSGVNTFDTSEMHENGRMETLLGRAIRSRRHETIIVTKGGFTQKPSGHWGEWEIDASPSNIRRAIDASLKRLNTDYIDVYLSHFPDPSTPLEATLDALRSAQKEGKILEFGLSNYPIDAVRHMQKYAPNFSVLQYHYSLLDRSVEPTILSLCEQSGKVFMAYRVLERGLLAGVVRTTHDPARQNYAMFQEPELSRIKKKIKTLHSIALTNKKTPAQVAIRWILSQPGVSTAIIGASSKVQLQESLGACDWKLPPEDVTRLNETFL